MIHEAIIEAYSVLETGEPINREMASKLSMMAGEHTMDLMSLAHKVKNKYSEDMHACSIINAKSGLCAENCKFCAQSAHNSGNADVYDLMEPEKILAQATECFDNGMERFGIVTSGKGFKSVDDKDFQSILSAIDKIKENHPGKKVCAAVGAISDECIDELLKRDIDNYGFNLQVAPAKYEELVATTTNSSSKVSMIKRLTSKGTPVCSGGVLGIGETMDDRIELAFTFQELGVNVIPLNVLVPMEGTPLEKQKPIDVIDVAKTFALFRLINPTKVLKFAAGRETMMNDYQGLLMLSGANGLLMGGYLTTRGRDIPQDQTFTAQLAPFSHTE